MDDLTVEYTLEEIAQMTLINNAFLLATQKVLIAHIAMLSKMVQPEIDPEVIAAEMRELVVKSATQVFESNPKISEAVANQLVTSLKRELGLS